MAVQKKSKKTTGKRTKPCGNNPQAVDDPPTIEQLIQAMRDAKATLVSKTEALQAAEDAVNVANEGYDDALENYAAAEAGGDDGEILTAANAVEAANGLLTQAEAAAGAALSEQVAAAAALRQAQTAVWIRAVTNPVEDQ